MTVRPILFSGPMVRALLDGRKTQTRRVLTKLRSHGPVTEFGRSTTTGYAFHWRDREKRWHDVNEGTMRWYLPYQVGDLLYVRESWRADARFDGKSPAAIATAHPNVSFMATDEPDDFNVLGKSRPSIHMPKRFSRLTLKVTDVRVEPLQDISEQDAKAEGVEQQSYQGSDQRFIGSIGYRDYRDHPHNVAPYKFAKKSFETLWDSLNEKRGFGWKVNPWVVAVTFEVHRCNVDQFERAAA